jgi:hypothetical protein
MPKVIAELHDLFMVRISNKYKIKFLSLINR